MENHPPMPLEIQDTRAEDLTLKDEKLSAPSSTMMAENNEIPVKRQTRQWAAWTRQEEENFFTALRQVGKNFEKITCRVQTKSKNQVRHYYYRLVRRMNKLLGPALSLDAKNSKDTNAAMLRWWSLLVKHRCTASKLHLKPRRFKIFVGALENQLLKDHNKTRRKRRSKGEKYLAAASTTPLPSIALGNDEDAVKLFFVDSQNTDKLGVTKGHSFKPDMSANINFTKGELPPKKPPRQKRRPGLIASAAYRRWEKAAMAGVSLVADAAEQLERASSGQYSSADQGTFVMLPNEIYAQGGKNDTGSAGLPFPALVRVSPHQSGDTVVQPPIKLKLQLFPVDEATRQALEKDGCNPHLELTLSTRKRISSVLEHLNRKWGNLSISSGELMLFPYSSQLEDANKQQRWSVKDTTSSAADVYASLGSPSIFRLRYGWFPGAEPVLQIARVPSPIGNCGVNMHSEDMQECVNMDNNPNGEMANLKSPRNAPSARHISEQPVPSSEKQSIAPQPSLTPDPSVGHNSTEPSLIAERERLAWVHQEISLDTKKCAITVGDWADSLTNISVGDLLSEASRAAHSVFEDSLSCDSFDAAVAGITRQISTQTSPASIWNAEETCDAFLFQNAADGLLSKSTEDHGQTTLSDSLGFKGYLKELSKSEPSNIHSFGDMDVGLESAKDTSFGDDKYALPTSASLSDVYWSDSLGPLDLDIPSSRYQGPGHIFEDSISLGSFSRMFANSLDAFQSRPCFGIEKETSTSEA